MTITDQQAHVFGPAYDPEWVPSAYPATWAEPESDEWFAVRRSMISATDLPRIMNLNAGSDYARNALDVWLDKTGRKPQADEGPSRPGQWGQALEPLVAEHPVVGWAAKHKGVALVRLPVLRSRDPLRSWQGFSPDYGVIGCPDGDGPCGLEVKTRSAYVAGRWREDIPDDVLAQVQWQAHVAGWSHVHVAFLLGGQYDDEARVDLDPVVLALLEDTAAEVWQHVVEDTTPPMDADAAAVAALDRLFPDRTGLAEAPRDLVLAWLHRYQVAHRLHTAAEVRKEEARAALITMMGGSAALVFDDDPHAQPVVTYRPPAKPREAVIRADDMRRLRADDPDLYDLLIPYLTQPTPGPTFRLTKIADQNRPRGLDR